MRRIYCNILGSLVFVLDGGVPHDGTLQSLQLHSTEDRTGAPVQ